MRLTTVLACLLIAVGAPLAHAATDPAKTDAATAAKEKRSAAAGQPKAASQMPTRATSSSAKADQKAASTKGEAEKKWQFAPKGSESKPATTPPQDLAPPSAGPR